MHQDAPPIRCCSKVLEHCDEFLPGDTPEYFFDKNPENFTSILNIYRTGNTYSWVRPLQAQVWGVHTGLT